MACKRAHNYYKSRTALKRRAHPLSRSSGRLVGSRSRCSCDTLGRRVAFRLYGFANGCSLSLLPSLLYALVLSSSSVPPLLAGGASSEAAMPAVNGGPLLGYGSQLTEPPGWACLMSNPIWEVGRSSDKAAKLLALESIRLRRKTTDFRIYGSICGAPTGTSQ